MLDIRGKGTALQVFSLINPARIMRLTCESNDMVVEAIAAHSRFVHLVVKDRTHRFTREAAVWFLGFSAGQRMLDFKIVELEGVPEQVSHTAFLWVKRGLQILRRISLEAS